MYDYLKQLFGRFSKCGVVVVAVFWHNSTPLPPPVQSFHLIHQVHTATAAGSNLENSDPNICIRISLLKEETKNGWNVVGLTTTPKLKKSSYSFKQKLHTYIQLATLWLTNTQPHTLIWHTDPYCILNTGRLLGWLLQATLPLSVKGSMYTHIYIHTTM